MEQIILFGDSITQESASQTRGFGFHPALQNAYIRRLDVINRGLSGFNTIKALRVLPKVIPAPSQAKVRILVVFFGANDACIPEAKNGQHVPLEQYKENLKKIVTHPAVVAHKPLLVLVTPPPIEEHLQESADLAKGYSQVNRRSEVTKVYADAVRKVGEELSVPVLDLWTAFMKKAGWKSGDTLPGSRELPQNLALTELMHDGLHLNPSAYQIFFDEFMSLIQTSCPEQMPGNLAPVLPLWNDDAAWDTFE